MTILRRISAPWALPLALLPPFAFVSCKIREAKIVSPRALAKLDVSLPAVSIEVGQSITATASAFDREGVPLATGPVRWTSTQPAVAGVSLREGAILALSAGTAQITATVDGITGHQLLGVSKAPGILVNEARRHDHTSSGWVELFNPTLAAVDLSGWTLQDPDLARRFTFPSGSTIPARGYFVIDAMSLPFSLDRWGGVHLFSRYGMHVSAALWTMSTTTTIGRCPDGTGELAAIATPTRGSANACPVVADTEDDSGPWWI
jgi:hypothetical protein